MIFKKTKNSLLPLRTMLTGLERGGDYNAECVGPMGLRNNFEIEEAKQGCKDDNFLNPLKLLKNEIYVLVVFSKNDSGKFQISKSTYSPSTIIDTYQKRDNELFAKSEFIHNLLLNLSQTEDFEYPILVSTSHKAKYSYESKKCGSIVLKDKQQAEMVELKVIPNPSSKYADIEFNYSQNRIITIQVLSEIGVLIKEETIYAMAHFIHISLMFQTLFLAIILLD